MLWAWAYRSRWLASPKRRGEPEGGQQEENMVDIGILFADRPKKLLKALKGALVLGEDVGRDVKVVAQQVPT